MNISSAFALLAVRQDGGGQDSFGGGGRNRTGRMGDGAGNRVDPLKQGWANKDIGEEGSRSSIQQRNKEILDQQIRDKGYDAYVRDQKKQGKEEIKKQSDFDPDQQYALGKAYNVEYSSSVVSNLKRNAESAVKAAQKEANRLAKKERQRAEKQQEKDKKDALHKEISKPDPFSTPTEPPNAETKQEVVIDPTGIEPIMREAIEEVVAASVDNQLTDRGYTFYG